MRVATANYQPSGHAPNKGSSLVVSTKPPRMASNKKGVWVPPAVPAARHAPQSTHSDGHRLTEHVHLPLLEQAHIGSGVDVIATEH